jgi:hypothetical protein
MIYVIGLNIVGKQWARRLIFDLKVKILFLSLFNSFEFQGVIMKIESNIFINKVYVYFSF